MSSRHTFDCRNLSPREPIGPRLPRFCLAGLSRFSD